MNSQPQVNSRKMRILQVLPALGYGGVERSTFDIAEALCTVFPRQNIYIASSGGALLDKPHTFQHIKLPLRTKNPLCMMANALRLVYVIKRHRINVVHGRSRGPAWSAWLACKITGTVFITTYHGAHKAHYKSKVVSWFKRGYNSVMARGCHVIAISDYMARHIKGQYPWASVRRIYTGIDTNHFSPSYAHQAFSNKENKSSSLDYEGSSAAQESSLSALFEGRQTLTKDANTEREVQNISAFDDFTFSKTRNLIFSSNSTMSVEDQTQDDGDASTHAIIDARVFTSTSTGHESDEFMAHHHLNEASFDSFSENSPNESHTVRTIFVPSRLSPIKGVHIAIKSFARVIKRYPHTRLMLIRTGKATYMHKLSHLIDALSLREHIDFIDPVTDLRPFYENAFITVVPSLVPEAFGRVSVEALAMKSILVATSLGATPEICQPNHTGLLIKAGSAPELTQALLKIFSMQSGERARLRHSGRAFVEENFSFNHMLHNTVALYEEAFKASQR